MGCQDNCLLAETPPTLDHTLPSPTFEPVLMELDQNGLYGIGIPDSTLEKQLGDLILNGSGEAGSNDMETGSGSGLKVYSVRISQFGNSTYFPMVSAHL